MDWPDEQSDVNLILSPPIVLLCHASASAPLNVPDLVSYFKCAPILFSTCQRIDTRLKWRDDLIYFF